MERAALFLISMLAVPTLRAETPAVVDGNGNVLGSYGGGVNGVIESPEANTPDKGPLLRVISTTGYSYLIAQRTGKVADYASPPGSSTEDWDATRYFTSIDCSGQAYVTAYSTDQLTHMIGGFVFKSTGGGLYYSPKTATDVVLTLHSVINPNGTCLPNPAGVTRNALPVFPNDPAITGLPAAVFPGPITVTQAVVPRPMFKDGFETIPGLS